MYANLKILSPPSLAGKKTEEKGAVCVGLSLPQGAGKTTLADSMTNALETMGYRVAVVSYDDFYLTRKDQESLQRLHKAIRTCTVVVLRVLTILRWEMKFWIETSAH